MYVFCVFFSGISYVGVNTSAVAKISECYYDGKMKLVVVFFPADSLLKTKGTKKPPKPDFFFK